ncbi:calcineurin-like phosphoesterase domain-containing protein [Ditylenchus destructor]|uniref:Tartrate-resistant acid phosphatase type 5 n=1 Tax=Ditylenchus destructor TaxID=166010 RepID=A0AAD4N1Q5_9BILA|nr:calcineurin-like phosphoesterase domain-containing protein [Ditylenchus destructor]
MATVLRHSCLGTSLINLFVISVATGYVTGNTIQNISLTPAGRVGCTLNEGCVVPDSKLDFLIIGDTGGLPIYPYYSYAQNQVARAMARTADKGSNSLDFVLNLGDNFYFNGVEDIYDSRFEKSFEEVYSDLALSVPWFTIAGNHDHLGNISAQLMHTNFSSKWTFPKLFYKVRYKFGSASTPTIVDILMLDTIVLCGNTKKDPNGPPPEYVELAAEQWRWIEDNLRDSDADFLLVAGHYPVYSTSEHGPFKCLIEKLDPLLRKYEVTAYFNGHDHNLQHIRLLKPGGNGKGTTMNYFVCGAASRSDRSFKNSDAVPENALIFRYPTGWNPFSQIGFSNGAFIHAEINADRMQMKFYTGKQDVKYETTLFPRRNNKR